jgi:ABC-type Fe3+/spermidine/putrescine transport system ATPase subunit
MDGPLTGATLRGHAAPHAALAVGAAVHVAIRPEDIEVAITAAGALADASALTGTIEALLFVGDRYEARVGLGGEQGILLLLPRGRAWSEGQRLHLIFSTDLVSVWPA